MKKFVSGKFLLVILFLLLPAFVLTVFQVVFKRPKELPQTPVSQTQDQAQDQAEVLGRQIYIWGGDNPYSAGGMIALAPTDEPAVEIGGYNVAGTAEIALYEANEDALLDYLTHDSEGKQTKKSPDVNKFRYVTTVKQEFNTGANKGSKISLPLEERGIWYLKVKLGTTETAAFVLRSNMGVIVKEGDNEYIFWGQNFKTKRSISEGELKVYNLENERKELAATTFTSEGIAKTPLSAEADIALVKQGEDQAVVPINLTYLNTSYQYKRFQPKSKETRYFVFTDRPLYRPGDTVYFKAVLRDEDDVRYTIPEGEAKVKIPKDYSGKETFFEKTYSISSGGTVSGEYQVPDNFKVGYYSLCVEIPGRKRVGGDYYYDDYSYSSSCASFDVEFFRKPEYFLELVAPSTELVAGDKNSFRIKGSYFSGQPLANQKVKYTVYSSDFYEYEYLTDRQNLLNPDYRYSYWYGSTKADEGQVTLNKNGEVEINLNTKLPAGKTQTQVFSIKAVIDDDAYEPTLARRNILVYAGEYGIYLQDYSYGVKVNTPLSLPVTLVSHRSTSVSAITLTAKINRESWISYQEPNQKYPSYGKEEEELTPVTSSTDEAGNVTFSFTPQKTGSYRIAVEGEDSRGNRISKIFYSYVSSYDQPYYNKEGNYVLTLTSDKQKYLPSDTVHLEIFSAIPDRDIFVSLERGRVNRFQIAHLEGKNGSLEIPLVETDVPNIYVKASSFSTNDVDTHQINLVVSPESKKLIVKVTPNSQNYGPGETATLNLQTTDLAGNPIPAEVAVWAVDKAIFELSDNKLGDIFNTFWHERVNSTRQGHSLEGIMVYRAEAGGGCFNRGIKVLMGDGKVKNIEEVEVGDEVLTRDEKNEKLVKARVVKVHQSEVSGYLIINGHLKVTANHILRVNDTWKEAGSIQVGDLLTDQNGQPVVVQSLEWQAGKFTVYNLDVEKYHTFFAHGFWVHNEKGVVRNVFKDTVYWNPSVQTNESGQAQVSFKLSDNLTTWTIAAVGATPRTQVGQTTEEIVVSKDVIVRPILPNILREEDEVVLAALVQNFTDNDQTFDVDLGFDAGEIEDATRSGVLIKSKEMQEFSWKVKVGKEKEKAKLTFAARNKDNKKLSDVIIQEIPIWPFGFEEQRAESGDGSKTFSLKIAPDAHPEKSSATLSLSPTLIGTLPTVMKYLIHYPYGCVEQTTSSFVPAVIAKANPDLFKAAFEEKDIDDIIKKGVKRLGILRHSDGGWAWWYEGRSDPFVTAYVVEYLLAAKVVGIEVEEDLLGGAQSFLEREDPQDSREDIIAKTYALALLGSDERKAKITDLDHLGPDVLAFAVMANVKNGDKNPQTNGLAKLISLGKAQGDDIVWEGGTKERFSSPDASTALAIRAILEGGGERELAVKGARYLSRNRKYNYWSNTFATAQVIRALVDLFKTGSEQTPKFTYTVFLDGQEISRGEVTDYREVIPEIKIPVNKINQKEGSKVTLAKDGQGQIYSTLVINDFHTDRQAKAVDHGLKVKREYLSEKGRGFSLAVGDSVTVNITVEGLRANEYYGVIGDELPAGLVPVNPRFKNTQYGQDPYKYYDTSYGVTDREVTQNGMVLSLYQIASGKHAYTYKARVVSEGTFIVPPTFASLMYAPEIYGRSETQTILVSKTSKVVPIPQDTEIVIPDLPWKPEEKSFVGRILVMPFTYVLIPIIVVLLGIFYFLFRKGILASLKEKLRARLARKKTQGPGSTLSETPKPETPDSPQPGP